jgi:hypothetical protein
MLRVAEQNQIFPESDRRWLDGRSAIWRYVPLRTLFFYLNGLVFIPSVEKLRSADPFEGEFYADIPWFNSAFSKRYGEHEAALDEWISKELCSESERHYIKINRNYPNAGAGVLQKKYLEFIRRTRFAWCWFQSSRESAAMWTAYGNHGVAIQSTVNKVKALFEAKSYDLVYGQMIYVHPQTGSSRNFIPERDTDLLLRPYFLKREEYESEKEVRFVTTAGEDFGKRGILVRSLKPEDWITAIRLWPGLTNDEAKSIKRAIEPLYTGVDCEKSDLFTRPNDHSDIIDTLYASIESSPGGSWPPSVPHELRLP